MQGLTTLLQLTPPLLLLLSRAPLSTIRSGSGAGAPPAPDPRGVLSWPVAPPGAGAPPSPLLPPTVPHWTYRSGMHGQGLWAIYVVLSNDGSEKTIIFLEYSVKKFCEKS